MIEILGTVLDNAIARLIAQVTLYLPSLLAALTLVLGAWLTALFARWLVRHIFKGRAIDSFLRQSGITFLVDPSGRLRATRLASEVAFYSILVCGFMLGLNVFGTDLSTQIVQGFVFLLPKLLAAALILLAGAWLAHYLSRSMLVWAVNENLPSPRRLAAAVRVLIMFVAVVAAADHVDFARHVFLAAFIIGAGGVVLAVSLAVGLDARSARRLLDHESDRDQESPERSLWSHL